MRYFLLVIFLMFSFSGVARADCVSPAGAESATRYDFTVHKLYYCDGTNWVNVGGGDNLGNHIASTVLRSDTNNTDDLGTSAFRWKDGWFAGALTAGSFAGSGAALTALNAANLSSGIVPAARLPAYTGDVTKAAGATATVIANNAVTTAKILDGTIDNADIANATIVATAKLSATGTKNNTTFLRGDNTWATPPGGSGDGQGMICGARRVRCVGNTRTYYNPNLQCAGTEITATCNMNQPVVTCPSGYSYIDGIEFSYTDTRNTYNVVNSTERIVTCIKIW